MWRVLGLLVCWEGTVTAVGGQSSGTTNADKFDASSSTWIDAHTEPAAMQLTGHGDNVEYTLVFSDEFEQEGRRFGDGQDFKWTAIDRPDTTNSPLEYYKPEMVTTSNGFLNITTTNTPVSWAGWNENLKKMDTFTRHYTSGMVQGWNKFCFTGGVVELSVQLPGPGNQPGLWPAAWLLGNLGRATWEPSTHGTWPYSFDHCLHDGHTPADVDDVDDVDDGQRLSACDKHPAAGLRSGQGRGAPEIDIFEAMAGTNWALVSHSLQVAPPLPDHLRPVAGTPPKPGEWYEGLRTGEATLNTAYYGANGVDAISANSDGSLDLYSKQHVFRLEWGVGGGGGIRWYQDDKFLFEVPATALQEDRSGLPPRLIPEEPMYLLLNTAMSNTWSPLCGDKEGAAAGTRCPKESKDPCCIFPSHYLIDYVRVYQQASDPSQTIGCDPPSHPTSQYISDNLDMYGSLPLPAPTPLNRMQSLGAQLFENFVLTFCVLMVVIALGLLAYRRFGKKRGEYVAL